MQKTKEMRKNRRLIPTGMMQVMMLFSLVLGIAFLFPGKAQAYSQGFWEYDVTDSGVRITRYTGGEVNVTIPSTLGNRPVVALGSGVFEDNAYLVTVRIPSTVMKINEWDYWSGTFRGCTALTTVYGLESVQYIGENSFNGCTALTSFALGNRLTGIGSGAFQNCTVLKSVVLPGSLTKVGSYAFKNCDSLTSIAIPASVTSLGYESFRDCDSLRTVSLMASLDGMGNSVFSDCTALTSVTVGGSVHEIGEYAFSGCTALTSVSLGEGVRTIDYSAFKGCTSLPAISIPGSVRTVGRYSFDGCNSLTSLKLAYGLIEIGGCAFANCTALTSVSVPNSVTYIGYDAFSNCTNLASAFLPYSVTNIADDDKWDNPFDKCPNVVLTCYPDSYAETYAQKIGAEVVFATAVPSTAFNLSKGTMYLMEDQMERAGYAIAPSNTTDAVVWESSASDIASVNAIGEVTAKSAGSATIIATTTSGIRRNMTVVVSNKPTGISFAVSEKTIQVGKTYTQKATVRDRNGIRTDIKPDYSSSNPSIARVDANGKVKGIAPGVVTISARTNGLVATYKITVAGISGGSAAKKAIKKLKVKKSGKVLKVTTIKGAKVKVKAKKSVLGKASKTVKANSKGIARIKFKKKIKKITVKITVSKSGYKSKTVKKKY